MISFWLALQFLTRIPIRLNEIPSRSQIAKSLLYYPVVGLLIGFVLITVHYGLSSLDSISHNSLLSGALVLTVWIMITGALHLDGLADSADAWVGGYGDKDKTLRIMKDPYCGPVGVVSLLLIMLIKFSVIASFSEQNFILLLLAPLIARSTVLWSFLTIPYVSSGGLGQALADELSRGKTIVVMLFVSLLTLLLFQWLGFFLILSTAIVLIVLKRVMMARIGGMTGDTLGAQIEIVEANVLLIGLIAL